MKIIQGIYEGAKTQVRSSFDLTAYISVGVALHQGSACSPYLFTLSMDVMSRGIKDASHGACCLLTT